MMLAHRDNKAMGRNVSNTLRARPQSRAWHSAFLKSRKGAIQSETVKRSWVTRRLRGQCAFRQKHKESAPTPEETFLCSLFPQAVWNHTIYANYRRKHGGWHWYKADLAFLQVKLDVEVDGGCHLRPQRILRDQRRDRDVSAVGWTVLRFSNEQVMNDTAKVKAAIESTISKLAAIQATASTA